MMNRMLRSEIMDHNIRRFLSTPISLLIPTLPYPKCHIVIVLLDGSSIFRNGGFIFIAQLVCQRSHNLATFPVVKN